ncbi:MAG: DNA repair protein RecO [Leptolyngbya sp. RL_3_1]|nr:DNA repair protein RecO [Leptolyngbya sp. RL_3_1]
MSRSYKTTGINLKGMPMGESDRLLTILTMEHGLIRAIAPGARKHKSRLGGRSGQFVINQLLVVQGKKLDKVIQAETVQSFPKLAADLMRLTASQYLAELVLAQALSEQPQEPLFTLFVEHLTRLEQAPPAGVLPSLCQGIFHLLALAGVAPEVRQCCLSQRAIVPDLSQTDWRVGFSAAAGGIVSADLLYQVPTAAQSPSLRTAPGRYAGKGGWPQVSQKATRSAGAQAAQAAETTLIAAAELALLQRLGGPELISSQPQGEAIAAAQATSPLWQRVEQLLRHYAQHHFDRPIRSANLIDTCFALPVIPPAPFD